MAKQIVLNYKGVEYTLEFDRKTVRRMEASGFTIDTDKPATMITELFRGAFQMHHRRTSPELIEDIWDAQRQKEKLLTELVNMYSEPVASLMDEDSEGDDENPTWKVL